MRTFTSQAHDSNYGGNQLLLLDQVLREECHYVDREALGHWCGLNRPWWIPESGYNLDDYLRLLRQLQTNEVPNIALRLAKRTRIDDIGVMGYAMLASPTLEKGLQIASHLVE
ncbi:MAG: AraC family transcriptional regulator ligand-binding domain-containing protein, partial [Pseudomonadota bacterium]|nr:AraC family transcriptional regulator ligand-binding domain-containing protein [Pseudomonadota bacterium]